MGQRVVGDEPRVREDDLLPLVDVGLQRNVQRLAPARGGDDVPGVDVEVVVPLVLGGDGLPEFLGSLVRRVGVDFPRLNCLDGRLSGVLRRREVRLAEAEVDGVLARRLEHFADARDRYLLYVGRIQSYSVWGRPAR